MEATQGSEFTRIDKPAEDPRLRAASRAAVDRLLTQRGVLDESGRQTRPLTREDVLLLIAGHDEGASELDFSGRDLSGADLSRINLRGIDLSRCNLRGARLVDSDLQGARLFGADLREARLSNANLRETRLFGADLRGASLAQTDFGRADFFGARVSSVHLSGVKLEQARLPASYKALLGVHKGLIGARSALGEEEEGEYAQAEVTYRDLKRAYTQAGMYDQAGELFRLEMRARRGRYRYGDIRGRSNKDSLLPRRLGPWLLSLLAQVSCGYGERPSWVVGWFVALLLGFTLLYWLFLTGNPLDALSYSAASLSGLVYGPSAPAASGWASLLGPVQAALGFVTGGLFLITLARKLTR